MSSSVRTKGYSPEKGRTQRDGSSIVKWYVIVSSSTRVNRSTARIVSSVRPFSQQDLVVPLSAGVAFGAPDVGRLDDQRVAFPVAPHVADILADVRRQVRPSIQRDDARVVNHLDANGHVVRRLGDSRTCCCTDLAASAGPRTRRCTSAAGGFQLTAIKKRSGICREGGGRLAPPATRYSGGPFG